MTHIILDLEFNSSMKKIKDIEDDNMRKCPFEIMEIGAVKLDEKFNEIDSFRILVKPVIFNFVQYQIMRKTKLKIQDLQYGFPFEKALSLFLKWIGNDYLLYTWSENDYDVMKMNCMFYNMDYHWFDNYIDIQQKYKEFRNYENVKSLDKSIKELIIFIDKPLHAALIDARYSAEILKFINGKRIVQLNHLQPIEEVPIEKAKDIYCPNCNSKLEIEYEKKAKKGKNYNILTECFNCNLKILRIILKNKLDGEKVTIETQLLSATRYDTLKKDILKSRRIKGLIK